MPNLLWSLRHHTQNLSYIHRDGDIPTLSWKKHIFSHTPYNEKQWHHKCQSRIFLFELKLPSVKMMVSKFWKESQNILLVSGVKTFSDVSPNTNQKRTLHTVSLQIQCSHNLTAFEPAKWLLCQFWEHLNENIFSVICSIFAYLHIMKNVE